MAQFGNEQVRNQEVGGSIRYTPKAGRPWEPHGDGEPCQRIQEAAGWFAKFRR